jgi:hypothetical protein
MQPTKTWKNFERQVATLFGTTRTPLSGGNSGHDTHSDTLSKTVYVEAKYRKEFAIFDWFDDVVVKAKAENKVPVMALKKKRSRDMLFVIRASDIQFVADEIKKYQEEEGEQE